MAPKSVSGASFTFARGIGGSFSWNNSTGVTTGENTPGANWGAGTGTVAGTTFPGLSGDIANITNSTSANTVLDLDQNLSVGTLNAGFNNTAPGTVTVASGGATVTTFTLTFDNGASDAVFTHAKGNTGQNTVTVTAPVAIAGDGMLALSTATGVTTATTVFSGPITSGLASGVQTLSSSGALTSLSGAISNGSVGGKIALAVTGGGLTLSSANTFSGGTVVSGGILSATVNGALGTGNASVLAAATSLTIGTGVTNPFSNNTASLTLAGGGVAGTADNGFLDLTSGANVVVGGLVLGTTVEPAGVYSAQNFPEYFAGTGTLTVVPEPSTWALVAATAFLGLVQYRRRVSQG